jgi:predicted CoA-substrate-specific enzyme activase
MQEIIGISLGSANISFVLAKLTLQNKIDYSLIGKYAHNGNPKLIFETKLKEINVSNLPVVVTGRKFRNLINLPNISEAEATEAAYSLLKQKYNEIETIASLGAESFIVYKIDKLGFINSVETKNQCASGTGDFFLQQIRRMDLTIEDAVSISKNCEPHRVSGRCSVFAKSDCTHALNKGVPKSEVVAGLSMMIADKVKELLSKGNPGKVLAIGGVTHNSVVLDFLKQDYQIVIPDESDYFEALGAAIWGLKHKVLYTIDYSKLFKNNKFSFSFHKPLKNYENKVQFKQIQKSKAKIGDELILGLDVGSTTTKAVLVNRATYEIVADAYLYTHGDPIAAAKKCYIKVKNQIPTGTKIVGIGTTGSGRHIAGLHAQTPAIFNEIIAHASAAVYFDSEVDTIFEIGGQDAKYTYLVNKVPADYAMNEACSAGTGSFIEESAYETLNIKVQEIENIAMQSTNPPNFSDQCAAFISSDIKTAMQEGISKEDVVAGLVYSICLNYVNRVKGNRQVGKKIFMQGGVCYNKAIPIAMAALTDKEIIVPPEPGLMGAFGVALEVIEKQKLGLLNQMEVDLSELIQREVTYLKPFVCKGGKEHCDIACEINLISINGKKYPFGGACNKYYNLLQNQKFDAQKYDFVKIREDVIFNKYAKNVNFPDNTKTIGINFSFHTHTLYPLYYNFFTQLGFRVILSDQFDERGYERELTSFCYPAQLSLGLFQNLIEKNPDYFFVPNIYEMYVYGSENERLDFNSTCVFVQGEPFFLKQAYKDYKIEDKIISPKLNFAKGWESQENIFVEVAKQIGIDDEIKAKEAYKFAVQQLLLSQEELVEIGKEVLKKIEKEDAYGIVLLGRAYNSFNEIANKGIPQKFASRGIYIIPYDMLDYRFEEIDDAMYWEGGKKILKSAKIISKNPKLFATYISNFSCGPDSLIITTFRELMGTKPNLTLELDSHSADAGINTRIDAFLDIVENYLKISNNITNNEQKFKIAELKSVKGVGFFVTPEGKEIPISSKEVQILIPSMGDIAAPLFASALRSLGFNAIALPEADTETLKAGRSIASGKECLPLLILAGSLIKWVENEWDGEKYIAFFNIQGAGNCRLGQYPVFLRHIIRKKRWTKVAQMTLMNEDGFAGFGEDFAVRGIQSILASDVLDDVRSAILANAFNPDDGLDFFNKQMEELNKVMETNPKRFLDALKFVAQAIKEKVPSKINIHDSKYIGLMGEIFVRRDGFSHKWLNKTLAKKGFVTKNSYISEWVFYVDYLLEKQLLEPEQSLRNKLERKIRNTYMRRIEKKIKKILAKSGYYEYKGNHIAEIVENATHILPLDYKGEPGIVLGATLTHGLSDYAGIINVGPFGCMPTRITEAVTVPELNIDSKIKAMKNTKPNFQLSEIWNGAARIPFLTIETDGNVYPQIVEAKLEAFLLQAERAAKLIKIAQMSKVEQISLHQNNGNSFEMKSIEKN